MYLKVDNEDTKEISLNALVFGRGNPEYRSISKTEQKCDKGSSYSFQKKKSSLKLWRKNQLIWRVNLGIVRAKNAPSACIVATWCPN